MREAVSRALAEDIGAGDITSEAVVSESAQASARIVQKQGGVLFGLEVVEEAFRQSGASGFDRLAAESEWRDGVPVEVARVSGTARALLAAERTALNFLGRLSGIATMTAEFVAAVDGTNARILDTRKTTPGLRALEKDAVEAGGGTNHRMGLHDAILIKENHVALAGGIAEAVRRTRTAQPKMAIEVECRDAGEVGTALKAGADRLLLDNMDEPALRAAVKARDEHGTVDLEASGGITLANVASIAATGVEFISVGALTHSAPSLDVSMLLETS